MMRLPSLFFLLLAVGLQASSQSLIQYPYNPDEDNNQNIGSPDLLGFLSYYGEPFTPEPILLDSVDLLTVIQNMNATINSLQQSVNSLQGQVAALTQALESATSEIHVEDEGSGLGTPSQFINFVGGGVSVSADTVDANRAVVTIPGGGGNGVYVVKLNYLSGQISSAQPFLAAVDASGNDILSNSNWSFIRDNANQITIAYPTTYPGAILDMMTHSEQNPNGNIISRMMHGTSTNQSVALQSQSLNGGTTGTVTFTQLTSTFTGISSDPFTPSVMYITFRITNNNILI